MNCFLKSQITLVMIGGKLINMNYKTKNWKTTFFIIWGGQAFSLFSSEIVQFSLVWWLTYNTGSATTLSIAMIISLLPRALLSPFIGALVDKWNRRVVLMISDTVIAACSFCLAILFLTGIIQIWHIYLILLIRAIGETFHKTSMLSSTSLMVPDNQLTRVAGMNQTLSGLIMFITPPLGGLLIKLSSFEVIMFLDVCGALIAVIPLMFIRIPQPVIQKKSADQSGIIQLFKDIIDGLKYIKNWAGATSMLIISTMINFIIRPVFLLVAIFVTTHFMGDEIQFGFIGAAMGFGFMSGGIVLIIWQGFKRKMFTSLMVIMGAGIAVLISGILTTSQFIPALFCFFAASFMMPFCMGPIQSLVQGSVRPDFQGRVFSIMTSVSTIISPISLALAGLIFDKYTPQAWYFWGGISAIIIGIVGCLLKVVRNLGVPTK